VFFFGDALRMDMRNRELHALTCAIENEI
jgi:hypothetical protein